LNFAFITNAMTAIHEYGAKGFWQSLLVFAVIAIGSNVADHYLGAGNFVSTELATLNQPASPTIVISPPNSGLCGAWHGLPDMAEGGFAVGA
jgi:hypothetical protein